MMKFDITDSLELSTVAHACKSRSWETETGELPLVHYQFGIMSFDKEQKVFPFESWIHGVHFTTRHAACVVGDMAYSYIFVEY